MSLWDTYLAPGDVRLRRKQEQQAQELQDRLNAAKALQETRVPRLDATTRARRQNALLYGGIGFTILSLVVTRRATKRKLLPPNPTPGLTSSSPNTVPPAPVDASLEAVQALGYATLNVFSLAMVFVGACATYFDFADVEDLRVRLRQSVGQDSFDGTSEADREIETWIAETLSRKDGTGGLKEGIAEKIAELEREKVKRRKEGEGRR